MHGYGKTSRRVSSGEFASLDGGDLDIGILVGVLRLLALRKMAELVA